MDPGDYATNVLSSNNFATVNYQYFEVQAASLAVGKRQLQKLEAGCRSDGALVQCDSSRGGIWAFTTLSHTSNVPTSKSNISSIAEFLGIPIFEKEQGTLELASLIKSKQMTSSTFTTPNNTISPSSSLDNALRNAQALNSRAIHQNNSQGLIYEQPTLSPGTRTNTGQLEPSIAQVYIHEYLISAVLGSILFQLCRNSGFIPFNSRTLILTPSQFSDPSSLNADDLLVATLDVSVTSLGSLVVKAHSDFAPGLRSLSGCHSTNDSLQKLVPGAALWLAPGGTAAKYCGLLEAKTNLASYDGIRTQDLMVVDPAITADAATIQSWKSKCLEWLSGKGVDVSSIESGGWVLVQVLGGSPLYPGPEHQDVSILDEMAVVAWPTRLCFQTFTGHERTNSTTHLQQHRDPLYFAENWFSRKEERAEMISKRQKERQMAEALSKEQADVESRALQAHFSPVALRRTSIAGAMYPTPPDAIHHLVGVTPSFDGTVSTPGNPNLYPSNDGGNVIPPTTEHDTDLWGSAEKKERHSVPDAFNHNDNDNDNLFGDIEEGDFFGTDVTDADFSFFDQPDDLPLSNKPISPQNGNIGAQETNTLSDGLAFDMLNAELPVDVDMEMENFDSVMLEPTLPDEPQLSANMADTQTVQVHETKPESKNDDISVAEPPPQSVSPPFDKETVFRQIFPGSVAMSVGVRRASTFSKIDFDKSLAHVNQKYDTNGQFSFKLNKERVSRSEASSLPTTNLLSRKVNQSNNQPLPTLARMIMGEVPPSVKQPNFMDYTMDPDDSSQSSDHDDASNIDEDQADTGLTLKNIWNLDSNDINSIASPLENSLAMDFENAANTPRSINDSHLLLLEADPADWPLTAYFGSPEFDLHSSAMSDSERVATAQILADQAISGILKLPGSPTETPDISRRCLSTRALMYDLAAVAKGSLEGLTSCTMRSFLEIQGIPVIQGLRLPPRPIPPQRGLNMSDLARISNPFIVVPPQLELRRSDVKISVLPSAVNFWDNLGLSPAKGTKDVAAVCIYPNTEGVALCANAFLDQMRSQYESFRLGTHERITSKELIGGLVPYAIESSQQNSTHYLALLKETVGRLGRHLATYIAEEKNLVVYFVYPNDDAQLLVHICSAFQHLFNLYRKALIEKKLNTANELVLQLVPLDFIASSTALVVQDPTQSSRLAMEVYDRCINFASSSSSPAILLEQPLPKIIDFKLSINPSASLLQENTCLHIAYAQSIDDRWISAAWTDNRGTQQMTASYCLGRKNEPISTSFLDIATEIWQTTHDYISNKKIHWRIMIAKVGVMDPTEMESWTSLAAMPTDNHASLTLVTVKTHPSLCLLPNPITLPPTGNTSQSVLTPASTPQPSQSSVAEASTPTKEAHNAATPVDAPAEPDTDSCLVDYTDQSWGAVLAHRLNNSNSLLELNPALISGYLIKRGGVNPDDPPILMEVNVIHSDVVGNPRTFHEALLREIISYYRGLGTLARVRGIVDPVLDCRPWHIAAAEKAMKALYILM